MEFIKIGGNTYKVSGLTLDEFKQKTGKSAKDYYELTGKKEPVKKVEAEKEVVKETIKKEAVK